MIAYRTGTTIFPREAADAGYARLVGSAIKRQAGIGDCCAWLREKSMAGSKKLHSRIIDKRYVAAAKALCHEEGVLEIDDGASVSGSGEGTYVQAWVWVSEP